MSSYEHVSVLPYPREQVWYALTDGELVERWLPAGGRTPEEGESFQITSGGSGQGRVLVRRRPREVAVELVWGSVETRLTLRLSEIVRGTRVTIEHTGFHGARAWMIAKRFDARVKKLVEKELPAFLADLGHDAALLDRLRTNRSEREAEERARLEAERAQRDAAAAALEEAAERRREEVRRGAEERQAREREQVERILSEQAQLERARLEADAEHERQLRAEELRQREKREEREAAALAAEEERLRARERAAAAGEEFVAFGARTQENGAGSGAWAEGLEEPDAEDLAAYGDESPAESGTDRSPGRQDQKETPEGAKDSSAKRRSRKRARERRETEALARDRERSARTAAGRRDDARTGADRDAPRTVEAKASRPDPELEARMRQRLFGELTDLLEAARGEALEAFRGRFHDAGLDFGALEVADGRSADGTRTGGGAEDDGASADVRVERSEAVAELERRQEHERTEARRLQGERELRRRRELEGDRGRAGDDEVEARLREERRMLEELLRERQQRERARFEEALDERLAEIKRAQEEARRHAEEARREAEEARRRIEEERRRMEEERRKVEEERRRLAEDETRRRTEEVARESVRRELERTRREAPRRAAGPPVEAARANLSPRERAAEERMRAVREQRAFERRRREDAAKLAAQDPETAAREARLRAAIEKADRLTSDGERAEEAERSTGAVAETTPRGASAAEERAPEEKGLGRRLSGLFGRKRGGGRAAADAPVADREGMVLTLHPDDEPGSTIDADKYHSMREAILAALPYDDVGVELKDLPDLVRPRLSDEAYPRHVSITWYCVRVKLDLEARGLLQVVPGSKPQRVRRVEVDEVRKEA